jgi:hypothetical protein
MLIWGRANPQAMQDGYRGVYLNKQDMVDMVQQIEVSKRSGNKIPVLIEHTGDGIGHVVSAWIQDNTLQCVLELKDKSLESAIGQRLVRDGLVQELSLGYLLDIKQSKLNQATGQIESCSKHLQEISLVKKGARPNCRILGVTNPAKK